MGLTLILEPNHQLAQLYSNSLKVIRNQDSRLAATKEEAIKAMDLYVFDDICIHGAIFSITDALRYINGRTI